jgi:hypothetical protein
MILRVLRLEVSMYNVYITNQFQATFAQGGGGANPLVELTVGGKFLGLLSQLCPRIRPLFSRVCPSGIPEQWTSSKDEFQLSNTFFLKTLAQIGLCRTVERRTATCTMDSQQS